MTDLTMSQFASKADLISAQAARIAELEAEVDAERHHHGIRNASAVRTLHALGYSWRGTDAWQPPAEQGKCLHQIAEPAASMKQIDEAIESVLRAALIEGGCSAERVIEAREATNQRRAELRTLLSTPQPCSRSHPHEEMTAQCELRTEIARLTNALARAEAQLAAAPQAVQAAMPDAWAAVHFGGKRNGKIYNTCDTEKECNDYIAMVHQQSDSTTLTAKPVFFAAAPAHPAEGVPAQAVAVADARSARQITDAIVENFKDAGWYVPSVDEALVLEAVSAAIVEHGTTEPLTGVATDVDSMARVLMAAFAKAEPEHPITRYPTSFVATFADMARAAIAAAQLAEGVPAQSYVVDFFKAKGFYPSPAQAFAAGVAFAATQPAAQGMDAKNCIPWVPVQERVPAWTEDDSVRVLALTADDDFGGEQVHDIKASDFYLDGGDGVIGTEITEACTHWVYRDDVWPHLAAQAKQGGAA